MKYPDNIVKYRPKGCIIKKVNNKYYVYKATSKRVEGKKYPVQVIEGLVGEIDDYGFHKLSIQKVNTNNVEIREYGFTNFILMFEEQYISQTTRKKKDAMHILHSLIVYLSPMSYLQDEEEIDEPNVLVKKYGIGIPNQITAISKIIEHSLEEIENLKYICLVKMGNKKFYSSLTQEQEKILERIGINQDDIKR